jgi:hypothetical protein
LNRAPDGITFNVIRLTLLKKIVNITLLEPIMVFFLQSLHLGSLRTYGHTDIGREINIRSLSQSKKMIGLAMEDIRQVNCHRCQIGL